MEPSPGGFQKRNAALAKPAAPGLTRMHCGFEGVGDGALEAPSLNVELT